MVSRPGSPPDPGLQCSRVSIAVYLDLAIARLHDSPNYVLSSKEVATAQRKWARKLRE
jgi:hypothetical protein